MHTHQRAGLIEQLLESHPKINKNLFTNLA